MIELQIGDIILVRGRRLRHKLTQVFSGIKLNHALVYRGNGLTQELNSHGVEQKFFKTCYAEKDIVIFRFPAIDALTESQRDQALIRAMDELLESTLDKRGVALMLLRLPTKERTRKPNSFLCNEYVEKIFKRANAYSEYTTIIAPNVEDLMRNDLHSAELRRRYNLEKVYDYRWT